MVLFQGYSSRSIMLCSSPSCLSYFTLFPKVVILESLVLLACLSMSRPKEEHQGASLKRGPDDP